ncbi:hypothetical protein TNCV_3874211 [Trichonephila clavipes]|nr:hypothetical protein TNCV_3874211 [Trichonephila clavipes]
MSLCGDDEEESNDELYNDKYDSSTETYPDNLTEGAIIVLDKIITLYPISRKLKPLKSLVLRCGCRRFGNPTFVYGLRNATITFSGISSDDTKYSALVANLDAETLSYVSDIALSPPNSDKYHTLSQRLITQFSDSETQKLRNCLLTFS